MLYVYKASNVDGVITEGEMDVAHAGVVMDHLSRKGLIPVMVEEKSVATKKKRLLDFSLFERVAEVDVITITRNLGATIKAGLSIIEALDILIADSTKGAVRKVLIDARTNVENGKPLSMTFANYPRIFPSVFVGLLKAGELSGKMDETLADLSRYLSREYGLKKKVKGALMYPMILLIGSFLVIGLLFMFVLPRLAKTFSQSGIELPTLTRILVGASNAISSHVVLVLALIVGSVMFFLYMRKTVWGRNWLLKIAFHIPVVGEMVRKVALVRFARTLGTLLSSGMPITDSLELVASAVGNPSYGAIIRSANESIARGVSLSETFVKYPDHFPRFLTSLISVGEKTGTLEQILSTFAEFMDEEVDNTVKNLTNVLEPVLLLFMGLFVGVIAVSILLPIYQLVGKFV